MNILFQLTIIGSIFSLILILLKPILIKRYGGSWYYYIWILVLFSFCFPYKFDLLNYIKFKNVEYNFTNTIQDNLIFIPKNIQFTNNNIPNNTVNTFDFFDNGILILYFIGFLLFLIYYVILYIRFQHKLKNYITSISKIEYLDCLTSVCYEMNINKHIKLKESKIVKSPVFTGIIKPTVILPARDFNIDELKLIFKHELTHYKRKDIIYKILALIVHIIHWFNPITYIVLCTVNEACEYSCDETVTKYMDKDERKKYGYMLLNQVEISSKKSNFVVMFSKNGKEILKRRMQIIMDNSKHKYLKITALFICCLILCSSFFHFKDIKTINNKNTKTTYEENTQHIETVLEENNNEISAENEEEAINISKEYIERFFNENTDNLSIDVSYNKDSSIQPDGWFVRLYTDTNEKTNDYAAWVMPDYNTIIASTSGLWQESETITEDIKNDIISDKSWFDRAKDIIEVSNDSIENIYFLNTDENVDDKMVDINVDLKNGSSYKVTLSYPDKLLKSISYYYENKTY